MASGGTASVLECEGTGCGRGKKEVVFMLFVMFSWYSSSK